MHKSSYQAIISVKQSLQNPTGMIHTMRVKILLLAYIVSYRIMKHLRVTGHETGPK